MLLAIALVVVAAFAASVVSAVLISTRRAASLVDGSMLEFVLEVKPRAAGSNASRV